MTSKQPRARTLLYRVSPYNRGVVFAPAGRAELVARINRALKKSKTWAQFRRAMPRAEYVRIIRMFDENGGPRPRGSDPFLPDSVPGFSDGDYPPWLQQEMEEIAHSSFWSDYGTLRSTQLNGDFWFVPETNLRAVCKALEREGWTVKRAQRLDFH